MCSAKNYYLRNADDKLAVPLPKTEFLKKNFSKNETRSCETLATFDELISTYRPYAKYQFIF